MKNFLLLLAFIVLLTPVLHAQTAWPQTLSMSDGSIVKLYQPQPDSLRDNALTFRSAFSVLQPGQTEPSFGTLSTTAYIETDRDQRLVNFLGVEDPDIILSGMDPAIRKKMSAFLRFGINSLNVSLPIDELLSEMDMSTSEKNLSRDLATQPPRILYATQPTVLVTIDGDPITRINPQMNMPTVVNTPYTIVACQNDWFCYGDGHWYRAPSATGPYSFENNPPAALSRLQPIVDKRDTSLGRHTDTVRANTAIPAIAVTTVPTELIQSDGEAEYTPIDGTSLLYMSNADNDIFIDTHTQLFYVLLSGRWYTAGNLQGPWTYIASDKLPADFSRVPEGSPRDRVLASVAETPAAREAVIDAQIPQTARIDRKTATTRVSYDGPPQFVTIKGTHLQYAVNTLSTVIRYRGSYYCVDNGIWFTADGPAGPWKPADARPDEVNLIPPDYPLYNCKYVYIYDTTPDYIYTGYTPGYLNSFIFGPTVVYGTGFYYVPWWNNDYYPRPWTWGFNMWYDPWFGWTYGYGFGPDWFNFGLGWGWGFWTGGWWGPRIYRPPYVYRPVRGHSIYEHDIRRIRPADHANNLYTGRQGIVRRPDAERIYTDRDGGVFRKDGNKGWQQRDGNTWKPLDGHSSTAIPRLEHQEQNILRGQMRTQNFQQLRGGGRPGHH